MDIEKLKKIVLLPGGKWYTGTIKYILENPLYKENKVKNKDLALV